jgi:hypothetical protein
MAQITHPCSARRSCLRAGLALALVGTAAGIAPDAQARITRLEILSVETPTFESLSFGEVGQYEKITARAHGEIDPSDEHNALITDIDLAPKNDDGLVEYQTDVQILKPVDAGLGSGTLFSEILNRGNKGALARFNDGESSNEPSTAAHAGDGLLMRLGYTIVWVGWQNEYNIDPGSGRMLATFPIAQNPDGSRITGETIIETIFDDEDSTDIALVYPSASLDQSGAKILVRNSSDGPRAEIPADAWSFVDERTVRLDRSGAFFDDYDAGAAYELIYQAIDPDVNALGFAATRDVVSFLKHEASDANPVAGAIDHVLAHGNSQSGRMLKGFIYWGFNQDEDGQIVFEGANPNISGAHAIALNERFGDANATSRPYENHTIGKIEFPFTYEVRTDPVSGETDGIFARCRETDTCPKVFHTDSGNEAWQKAASLVVTDGQGNDIELPDDMRVYYFASTQHGPAGTPSFGICQQLSNPNPWEPNLQALIVALDEWVTEGKEPPESRHPMAGDGTLVPSLPQAVQGFPQIPGVTYNGVFNQVTLLDKSSLSYEPIPGTEYVVLVPRADSDGNDIAGIRSIDVQVPLATYTGWGLRAEGFAENEDCGLQGQYIPFAETREERLAAGDPQLSIEERYRSHGAYVGQVARAAIRTVSKRLLLADDANAAIEAARESEVGEN